MTGLFVSSRGFRRVQALGVLLAAVIWLTACRAPSPSASWQRFEFTHPAMGTLFSLTLYAPAPAEAETAAREAFHRIDVLEDIMSDYQADSELMQLCDKPWGQPVHVSAELFEVLQRAEEISRRSDGAFDVTVGPYVRLWRFARKRKVLPSSAELATAKAAVGYQKLRLDGKNRTVTLLAPNMRLDLGGIAKGYAADQVLALLKSRGISQALIAASGDIAVGDAPPGQPGWKVGIAMIDARNNETTRTVVLHDCGISTSGDTEQFIEIDGVRYSHILDPATGLGLTNRIQASIVAPDATTTDAVATTVCVLSVRRGLKLVDDLPGAAALILTKDGEVNQSFASRRFKRVTTVP